jgi:Ni2+-binding GTPase involved in maturation of urease and hydrogenase
MKLITVSGPPSSGKTSVILKLCEPLKANGLKIGIVKFDCLATQDDELYRKAGLPVTVGLSANLCPDHFFISNIEACVEWGLESGFDLLITESAGLCNRCSPHIRGVYAVCVIDSLSGVNTPRKIGPMLKLADQVVITKGDIISQAEREVFCFKVRQASPRARVSFVNGLTGQGAFDLCQSIDDAAEVTDLHGVRLRFPMPAALCAYCLGETRIGKSEQVDMYREMKFEVCRV